MEFVSSDPRASVRAGNIRSTLDAFQLSPRLGKQLCAKHGLKLEDVAPDSFVPLQPWLNALRQLQDEMGVTLVRQVGKRVVENANFPPSFPNVESVLLGLDQIYYLNHRGNVGHYRASKEADGAIVVRCETPFPRAFERGLVEGIVSNPKLSQGRLYYVDYTDGPPKGDLSCTLKVT